MSSLKPISVCVIDFCQREDLPIWFYSLGYLILIILIVVLFWRGLDAVTSADAGKTSVNLRPSVLRNGVLMAFAALAGLPPFFFFFCKLALLVRLIVIGSWGVAAALLALLMLAWYSYHATLARLSMGAATQIAIQATYTRFTSQTLTFTATVALVFCVLILGTLLLDDGLLLSWWVTS